MSDMKKMELQSTDLEALDSNLNINPKNDYIFGAIFGEIPECVTGLFCAVTQRERSSIQSVEFLPRDLRAAYTGSKSSIVDVKAVFSDGSTCSIEIQLLMKSSSSIVAPMRNELYSILRP